MNEIKNGYKKTKVGVIPEEWEVKRLGEVASFYKGKGISKAEISNIGIECIRYGELYTKYKEKIINIISKTNIDKEKLFLSKKNDILIPASGETAIDLATASCVLKDNIALGGDINIIRTKINGIFLSYYLNVIAKTKIASLAQGVSVIHLYSSQLKNLFIPLPPLPEQEKIAEILSIWDKAIEKQEELIKEKEILKKGLMQVLLEKKEGWEVKKLGEVCEITRGASPRPISKYITKDSGSVNWLKIGDIDKNAKFITKTKEKITIEGSLKSRVIEPNDFILSNSMSFGRPYISKIYACIHDGWLLLKNKNKKVLLNDYLYEILSSDSIKKQFISLAAGSGVKNLKSETVKNSKIPIPPLPEQEKIASILSTQDKEIDLLKEELGFLKEQKKGLMQRLLTGEVRVKV